MFNRTRAITSVFCLVIPGLVACGDNTGIGPGDDAGINNNRNLDASVLTDAAPRDAGRPDARIWDAFVRPPGDAYILPDSSVDAFVHPNPSTWGPAMVLNTLQMSGSMQGLAPFSTVINPELSNAVANGSLLMVIEFLDLNATDGVINDPDVTIVVYRASDADGNPGNNFTGSGQFYVEAATATVIPDVAITNGSLSIAAGTFEYLSVSIPNFGDLLIIDPALSFTVQTSFAGLSNGLIDGAVPARTLDALPDETGVNSNPNASLLDMLVTSAFELQPDVDVDGDGQLEEFYDSPPSNPGWDELISYCVDYFGLFEDENCPQFPEIWDGYSVELNFTAVPATIVGSF